MNAEEIKLMLMFIGFKYSVLLLVCTFFYFKPPKNINRFYGYRTSRAKKNIQNWRYANEVAAKFLFIMIHISTILALATLYWLRNSVSLEAMILINVCWIAFFPLLIFPLVEFKLSRFEESGNAGRD